MARILLIEDEDLVRATLRTALEGAGHTVAEAANGREGLNQLDRQPTDLVITDILMPVMEGIETILAIKRTRPSMKIIAISGAPTKAKIDFLRVARSLGADEILHKPFAMHALTETVERCLSRGAEAQRRSYSAS
jgi:CheY-like chemotaxis protein